MQPRIAIIGAGIAGCTIGNALRQAGFDNIFIFERDESLNDRKQGYGLTLMQGLSALRHLNLISKVQQDLDSPALVHYTFYGPSGSLLGIFGTVLWSSDSSNSILSLSNKRNLHVSRQALRKVLIDEYCENYNGALFWGYRLISIQKFNNVGCFELIFEDKPAYQVDIIIGADGINSTVRKLCYPSNELQYLGSVVVLGIAPLKENFFGSENIIFESLDGKYRFYAMPHKDHEKSNYPNFMWQLSFLEINEELALKYTKISGQEKLKNFLLEQLGQWHAPIPQLIKDTPLPLLLAFPIYDRGVDSFVPFPLMDGIWLIGDAVHPMSPFKGQGANQALLDAVALTDLLAAHYLHNSSLTLLPLKKMSQYYISMMDRVAPKILKSRERITRYHNMEIATTPITYAYGEFVTPQFIAYLNSQGLNSSYNPLSHCEPLHMAIKRELETWILRAQQDHKVDE